MGRKRTGAPSGNKRERPMKKKPKVDLGYVDYKDYNMLRRYTSDRGKIRARRVTGLTPHQQREVALAIKRAREMALLPYVTGS
ncbi:30S ribosomal protein S18 [soil metagenome]|jgi:small subunit ribosomal protein S18|nr:30S ribosomal protein S18 [Rubrobacter sp.]